MDRDRPLKKDETVEVRLSHAAKTAFMARCKVEGRTASEAIRCFIDAELSQTTRRSVPAGWRQLAAAALAGLALGAVAVPALAQSHATPSSRAAFDRLDRNHDGVVSFDEYRAG
jgi:hypothetical protein